jgi:tRNA G18 (ribose-2'-O)-methylase SpoU
MSCVEAAPIRNEHDILKKHSLDTVKSISMKLTAPYALMLFNCHGDFNTAVAVRTATCFSAQAVYTVGRRKFDRRPMVGAQNYIHLERLGEIPDPRAFFAEKNMFPVFIEQGGVDIDKFDFRTLGRSGSDRPDGPIPCLIVGNECDGLPEEFMALFPDSPRLSICQPGPIRSFNVATACAMALHRMYNSYKTDVMDRYGLF